MCSHIATAKHVLVVHVLNDSLKRLGHYKSFSLNSNTLFPNTILITFIHFDITFFKFLSGRSDAKQSVYIDEAMEIDCGTLRGKTARWSKDGTVIQESGAGYGTSLLIGSVQPSDEGTYTCEIINEAGDIQASYNVTLTVEGKSFTI